MKKKKHRKKAHIQNERGKKKSMKEKLYPPILAMQFYFRFEKIHPFLDGNGRVGRILLNSLLHKYSYMPVIFFSTAHQSHCEAIRQALEGRPKKFYRHFLEQVAKSHKNNPLQKF